MPIPKKETWSNHSARARFTWWNWAKYQLFPCCTKLVRHVPCNNAVEDRDHANLVMHKAHHPNQRGPRLNIHGGKQRSSP
jgi:hypothetical protein